MSYAKHDRYIWETPDGVCYGTYEGVFWASGEIPLELIVRLAEWLKSVGYQLPDKPAPEATP